MLGSEHGGSGTGLPVVILLDARKFFCAEESCRQKIFTERLPGTVDSLCTEELQIERSPEMAHTCSRWPSRSTAGMPAGVAGQQIDAAA